MGKKAEIIGKIIELRKRKGENPTEGRFINKLYQKTICQLEVMFEYETLREKDYEAFKKKCQKDYDEMLAEVHSIERYLVADITKEYGLRILGNTSNGYKSLSELKDDFGIRVGGMKSERDTGRLVVILKATIVEVVDKQVEKPQPQSEYSKMIFHDDFGRMVGKPRNENYEKKYW